MVDEALIVKYRPRSWKEVVGQNEIVNSLKQILKKASSHSFLFVGPSGLGKTTIARLLAYELGAVNPGDITEVDAGQITGIDDMRTLTAGLKYKPIGGSTIKAIILNECHRLTIAAQDALLAALEEPASYTYFFLTTTEGSKIRAAIKTRCTSYQLKLVSNNTLFDLLLSICEAEQFKASDTVLELCIKEAYGSPRQAIANLAVCSDLTDRETAATLLRSANTEGHEAIDLCRAIMQGADWEQITPILIGLQEQNPESIRQVVRAYMTKTILETKHEGTRIAALNILEVFSQPFTVYDGISPVILACGKLSMITPEIELIDCAECGKPVETRWKNGLLPGDYVLIADWIFHPQCWDKKVERYEMLEDSYTLQQDVIIPAGTKFHRAPNERGGVTHIEAVVGLGKDCVASLNLPVSAVKDAEEWLVKD